MKLIENCGVRGLLIIFSSLTKSVTFCDIILLGTNYYEIKLKILLCLYNYITCLIVN